MSNISLIPVPDREGLRCAICNETRSVKYKVKNLPDGALFPKGSEITVCNRCVIPFMDNDKTNIK